MPHVQGLETAVLKSVSLLTFFALTLPSPGRVEDEINKCSRHLTPKIPPLVIIQGNFQSCRNPCLLDRFFANLVFLGEQPHVGRLRRLPRQRRRLVRAVPRRGRALEV